ncbi:MAG: DNA polymerase III subunit delta [Verrucomicrobia bacterium]|nr:DNA polymerase III subunit delta [Verrucomicrobiota bacterium]
MAPFQLVFGDDEFHVTAAAREIVDALVPEEERVFGLESLDGRADTVDHALSILRRLEESLFTLSFLGGRKLVWLQDANFLYDTIIGRSEGVKSGVSALAASVKSGLPDGHVLLVTAPKVDKRMSLYKSASEIGQVQIFDQPNKPQQADKAARGLFTDWASDLGLQARQDVVAAFVERAGTDTRTIMNELEKLGVYLGEERSLSTDEVERLVTPSREIPAWDLADAIGRRDLPRALSVLRQLVFQRVSPIALIAGIEGRFRDLVLLGEALDHGWAALSSSGRQDQLNWQGLPLEVAEQYDDMLKADPRKLNPYRASILASQARNYSAAELEWCQRATLRTHKRLVSTGLPAAVILELLVVDLIRPKGRKRAPRE